ncbi:MAG: phosphatidylglycerophosphatase A [Candidatus Marinimicrobia bacterium]|nr:phosphatidylglycerophosphatase A [Candidatus Neomarinimicrobiota bacterium]
MKKQNTFLNKSKLEVSRFFTTFFYVGYFPKAPGTFASILAAVLIFVLPNISTWLQGIIIILLLIIGKFTSAYLEKTLNIEDPGYIVIDEVLGMWIAVFALPRLVSVIIIGFVLFRIFDIWKPWVIDDIQSVKNGWGVMLDDLLAGSFALLINYIIHKIYFLYFI